MSINITEDMKAEMRSMPFGEFNEIIEGEDILGKRLEPVRIPEDDIRPGAKFVFGEEVADVFEEKVIPRQVPGYEQMRFRTNQLGVRFVRPGTSVLDLGTSRARMIRDLITYFALPKHGSTDRVENVTYVGVDNEEPMLAKARVDVNALFAKIGGTEADSHRIVDLVNHDLRTGIPVPSQGGYSLVTSILTLQFVPIEYRQYIIQDIYDHLAPEGAFIWVEKVLGTSAITDRILTETYHDEKRRNGISEEAIVNKRESIEGFLVPQTSKTNQEFLYSAGFKPGRVEVFWRDLQFEAYVAIKE